MENENKDKVVNSELVATDKNGQTNKLINDVLKNAKQGEETTPKDKTFTQEEVNNIVRERLSRANVDDLVSKYGFKTKDEFVSYVDKLKKDNDIYKNTSFFAKNGVIQERLDDVFTYFKGKDLEINDENFKTALESHPEWTNNNVATLKIGANGNGKKVEKTEQEQASELFGIDPSWFK